MGMMADDLDMENRDPNGINSHLAVEFEEVLGEPNGAHSIDCVWRNSYRAFTCALNIVYKILTTLCGICIACYWGCVFACVAFQHVWCVTPQCRLYEINCGILRKFYQTILDTFCAPLCAAIGNVFSRIEVTNK